MESTWPRSIESRPGVSGDSALLVAHAFGATHKGKVRAANEDQFLIASPARALGMQQSSTKPGENRYADIEGELFVVADGMGGHAGGAQASALAVGAVEASLLSTMKWLFNLGGPEAASGEVLDQLKAALRSADAKVCEEAARTPALRDMGTTLTMAYRHGNSLFVAHAGDSRCYLLRAGTLHRITHDHTLVGEMVRRGVLGTEEAARHELRHIVTNAVGGSTPGVKAEVHRVRLEANDTVLLCTDGLTEMAPDPDILKVLRANENPRDACERLIALANDRGGRDNITVIVARFEPRPEPPPPNSHN